MIAIVRVRGLVKVRKDIRDTMDILRLKSVNNCVVITDNPVYRGMIQKIKDYVTWGEIEKDVFKKMLLKWGRTEENKRVNEDYFKEKKQTLDKFIDSFFKGDVKLQDVGIRPFFRLHPPRKGYEGVKRPYSLKGALGKRGKEINKLLERMI